MTIADAPTRRAPRRRRAWWRWWVGALVVLLVLLVAADRIAVAIADTEAAKTFQKSEGLDHRPSVRIRGFPFLTQLAGRDFRQVDLTATDLLLGHNGKTGRVSKLTLHLHHVRVSSHFNSARADTVQAEAFVSYADLSSAAGIPIAYAGPSADGRGRIKATKTVTVAGQQITGQISAEVRISADDVLSFVNPQVSVAGATVPQAVADQLATAFGAPIPLVRLPFGLRLQSVTAGPTGITISLQGANLSYSSG